MSCKFFEMMVPQDYIPVCDLKMDFPSFVAEYFQSNSDEKKTFFRQCQRRKLASRISGING